MNIIQEKLKLLPTNPGVYVMLNNEGQVIYVGKAKNLKNRVRQYFFNGVKTNKVMAMVSNVADFYYIIAPSEVDALSLENNLIKKHKPRYNILLKDDKTYPYLKIDLKQNYPTFSITRKIKKDGAKYFGPYMAGISVKDVLETVNSVFSLRPCDKVLGEKAIKPCLNYHIKKCLAPCAKLITEEEYALRVQKAIAFLGGETASIEKEFTEKMLLASQKEEFEIALKYKQKLNGLEKIKLKRITSLNKFLNADVISTISNGLYTAISVLFIRNGRMHGAKNFSFNDASLEDGERLREFILRYYKKDTDIPEEIITSIEVVDSKILAQLFKKDYNKNTSFICAKQGVRKQLLDMAEINAKEHLEVAVDKIKHKENLTISACQKLKEVLNLKAYPKRMECYDISNISGVDKVGSMVVFIDGEKDLNSYRRFKINTVEGIDDYKSHKEVLTRRLTKLVEQDPSFPKPNLIIIDGGKGQLSVAQEVFREFNITDIDLIALAEREEEIFVVNNPNPIVLKKSDYCLRLLQRIRDEAHRFAITYHRSLRSKRALTSVLDGINGIGKAKKQALLLKFKDLDGIISAKKEDLMQVNGIGESLAEEIIAHLTKEGLK